MTGKQGKCMTLDRFLVQCPKKHPQASGELTRVLMHRMRVMEICPDSIHQRIPFAIGSQYEITEYEKAYAR